MPTTPTHEIEDWRLAVELGLTKVYKDEVQRRPKMYATWLRDEQAQRYFDTEWFTSGLGIMPSKAAGASVSVDRKMSGPRKTYTMVYYALGLVLQHEVRHWDLYGVFKDLPKALAASATDRYNIVAYDVFNKAFSTADPVYTTFQSEALCKLAHTRIDGGTWKNRPTTNIGLSYTALMAANIDHATLVEERGRYMMVTPRMVVTGPTQDWIAQTIVKSRWREGNANQEANLVADMRTHSAPYITSTTAFWVLCDKGDYKIKLGLGESPQMVTDQRVGNLDTVYVSYCAFRLELGDSRGIWGSSGDGAAS